MVMVQQSITQKQQNPLCSLIHTSKYIYTTITDMLKIPTNLNAPSLLVVPYWWTHPDSSSLIALLMEHVPIASSFTYGTHRQWLMGHTQQKRLALQDPRMDRWTRIKECKCYDMCNLIGFVSSKGNNNKTHNFKHIPEGKIMEGVNCT